MKALSLVLALCGAVLPRPATAAPGDILARTRQFLDAYAHGDVTTLRRLVDPTRITVYGSDRQEFVHGLDELLQLMRDDQELWAQQARIGAPEKLSLVRSKDLATIFFEAPFSLAARPAIMVRFALVWQRVGGHWLLVQSANTVPSEHQSAAELLGRGKP